MNRLFRSTNAEKIKHKPGLLVLSLWLAALIAGPDIALAHPAEQALVMLLPTEFYTAAGTAAVALTIALIAFLPVRHMHTLMRTRTVSHSLSSGSLQTICSLLSTLSLFLLIGIGFVGPNDPQSNLLPLSLWTGWWMGVFVVQGMLFDVWKWINPWTGLIRVLNAHPVLHLPERLQAWPAVVIFTLFQLFLIVDIAPADPERLATVVLLYWLFTMTGIVVFGEKPWLNRVECFTVMFNLIASLRAVIPSRADIITNNKRHHMIHMGLPGHGSAGMAPVSLSISVLCLMILISGSFDGLRETFWWLGLINVNPLEFPGRSAVMLSSSLGLIISNIAVLAVYALSLWIGLQAVTWFGDSERISLHLAFNTFSVSILPIALGYHFAHYFVSFLVQSQVWVATLADPLASGWNLFGLSSYRVTTGFLNSMETVKPILLTNVYAVVISHIVAVLIAHYLASRLYRTRRDVVLVQIGLSSFMLVYTLFGLWLLSTPRGA